MPIVLCVVVWLAFLPIVHKTSSAGFLSAFIGWLIVGGLGGFIAFHVARRQATGRLGSKEVN